MKLDAPQGRQSGQADITIRRREVQKASEQNAAPKDQSAEAVKLSIGPRESRPRRDRIDRDGSGGASAEELQAAIKAGSKAGRDTSGIQKDLENLSELDKNGDGELQRQEAKPRSARVAYRK